MTEGLNVFKVEIDKLWVMGPRKQCVVDELIEVTDKHLSDLKPLFVRDGLKFYAKYLLKNMEMGRFS